MTTILWIILFAFIGFILVTVGIVIGAMATSAGRADRESELLAQIKELEDHINDMHTN